MGAVSLGLGVSVALWRGRLADKESLLVIRNIKKSFTALSKSLLDLLPEKTKKQAGEELLSFATKPTGAGRR